MRILVMGAGVIGSVYAGHLLQDGHDVELLARGQRLADLTERGLVLEDMSRRRSSAVDVPVVTPGTAQERPSYSLVIVPVRRDQFHSTLDVVAALPGHPHILFFGNTAGVQAEIVDALGEQALFGFPAVGGVLDGPVVRYLRIRQQRTMLAEPDGRVTMRVMSLRTTLRHAGFRTSIAADFEAWLLGHTAFIVPIAYALYRCGTDAGNLAADPPTLRIMVQATHQGFGALRGAGKAQIPLNLRLLYLRLPTGAAVGYWRRVMAGPRGEYWFAGHCRAAREEMLALSTELQRAVHETGRPAPALEALLATT
jgi:2-dehydropantoate 2-reductase